MIALALALLLAEPQTITGKVVAVHDGDTLTLLDGANCQHKIRLAGIDAPELGQAYGRRAREALAEMVGGQPVDVRWTGKDRYGRILGDVYLGKRWVNRELLAAGYGWHYRQYSKSKELQRAEDLAREKRAGLWADEAPTAPWEWRRRERERRVNPQRGGEVNAGSRPGPAPGRSVPGPAPGAFLSPGAMRRHPAGRSPGQRPAGAARRRQSTTCAV